MALLPRGICLPNIHTQMYIHGAAMSNLTTRVFMNGNSQAVRIPAEFRLDTDRVHIFRNEQGDLVLHPLRTERGAALLQALQGFDDDFIAALEADQQAPEAMQDRETL